MKLSLSMTPQTKLQHAFLVYYTGENDMQSIATQLNFPNLTILLRSKFHTLHAAARKKSFQRNLSSLLNDRASDTLPTFTVETDNVTFKTKCYCSQKRIVSSFIYPLYVTCLANPSKVSRIPKGSENQRQYD
jgi:hypothetical protein